MARVLYVAFDVVPSPKGASTHITHFVRGLTTAGHAVRLITAGDGLLPAEDEFAGAQVSRVPPAAPGEHFLARALGFQAAVATHLAQSEPYDVAHYRSIWGGLALAQAKTRCGHRTLFEVNGLPSVELKYHYPALRDGTLETTALLAKIREQELATLALSDVLVCPSAVTRAYLASLGVPRGRITVIPNGVSPVEFARTPLPQRDAQPPTVLYIGTLADWQGLELIIDAMPAVLAQRTARLRIVGRGRGRQRKLLLKRIRKLGLDASITIEPAVPHHAVPALLAEADVCIAPLSLNDRNVTQGCCPIKVLECMAAGRPLVAANLPVVRELAREDVDALLFAPDDPADLARQLLRALADRTLAERLALSAAARARSHFTWHHAQKKLARVYDQLLNAAPSK
jgi:glycosyltransferase involved in cell wall biosynthesis